MFIQDVIGGAMGGVEVQRQKLQRAWRRTDWSELFLQFRPDQELKASGVDVVTVFEDVLELAAQDMDASGLEEDIGVVCVGASDKGPVAALDDKGGTPPAFEAWMDSFTRHAEAAGLSGILGVAPEARHPAGLPSPLDSPWIPACFVAYQCVEESSLTIHQARSEWLVPEDVTQRVVAQAVEWAQRERARTYVRRELHTFETGPDVAPLLRSALAHPKTRAGLRTVGPRRGEFNDIQFSVHGTVVQQCGAPGLDLEALIGRLLAPVVAQRGIVRQAFIRSTPALPRTWAEITIGPGPHPPVDNPQRIYHVLEQYAVDAHGVQVLTDAHLEKAHDLTDWDITDLGDQRHLVRHRDAPAFYTQQPDPDLIASARHDFGPMLLTEQTLHENPKPWARDA